MNCGDKSTASSSSSSRGNGGKVKKKSTKVPQRGMGVAKLEEMRLSSRVDSYQQEFDAGGQAMVYHPGYAPFQSQTALYYPFEYHPHQQQNTVINFGSSIGVNIPDAGGNDINLDLSVRLPQQSHCVQPVMGLHDLRQRREEGAPSGDEDIDLELRL